MFLWVIAALLLGKILGQADSFGEALSMLAIIVVAIVIIILIWDWVRGK